MNWNFFFHVGTISIALLLSALIRARVRFFQRYLIPAPILAGMLLLVFYNFGAPKLGLRSDFLGDMVYHLLNISFIAMLLRVTPKAKVKDQAKRTLAANVTAVMAQYGLQAFFGLVVTALLIAVYDKNLFPAIGYTLPLGFELGPGQAYSIGMGWEPMGFEGASSVGLTMAAIGFLVGSFGGVILINQGIKYGWIAKDDAKRIDNKSVRTGFFSRLENERPIGAYLSTDGESLDSFTYHIALVMLTYLISWGFLTGLSFLLGLIGPMGTELADSLWGINFIFSAFCALAVKMFMKLVGIETTIDNATCNRINGLSVDLTVAASLGAISLVAVKGYWVPIVVLSITGIIITVFILPWYTSRLYDDHQFLRMLLLYGTATGTLPTGLSLVRVIDQEFETPVATDYLYSVGIVFVLAIPFILTINFPAFAVTKNNPVFFYLTILIAGLYLLGSFIAYIMIARKRSFIHPRKLFYVE
ncbi:MAG TPA: sodium:glutamate symporter [Sphaerochaeta sp.]|jgi:ESS family glutamate:Na+ symporter|nr:sodium:glutamate symporter [Sphaerochaeta sp.]HQB54482.1 sodium:glutamate symporter [Sphaerochaeta sp.]